MEPPGEPVPACTTGAPELCNGRDDDCDTTIDEGCPSSLMLGNAVQRKAIGDSVGGSIFAETCATDEVLVGLSVAVGAWLEQLTPVCQKFRLSSSTSSFNPGFHYSLELGSKRALPAHPEMASSGVRELVCAQGTLMVGARISQQHYFFGALDYIVVPQISIKCAEPSMRVSDDSAGFEWHNPVDVGPISGFLANGTAWFEADVISSGEALVGLHGATGGWVDRLGLTASPLKVVFQPD